MKSVFILRHADAPHSGLFGQERVLSIEGMLQVESLQKQIRQYLLSIDFILCSGLTRARQTLNALSESIPDKAKITFDDSLAKASSALLLDKLQWMPNTCNHILIIGHNPGLSQFLSDVQSGEKSLSPCSGVLFDADIRTWQDVAYHNLRIKKYICPA